MFKRVHWLALAVGLVGCGDEAGTSPEKNIGPGGETPDAGKPSTDGGGDVDAGGPASSEMLLRRAELKPVDTPSAPLIVESTLAQCADGRSVSGVLDRQSSLYDHGSLGMRFDAYVVTALTDHKSSVFSAVSAGNAETYEHGYGFPFTLQTIDRAAPLPALSMDLVRGMPLADDALNGGKARLDLTLQAGKQYVLTFKNLQGPATPATSSLNYTLTFCGTDLRVEGKLWISDDETDLIPSEELVGPISVDNASAGAMAQLASGVQPGTP